MSLPSNIFSLNNFLVFYQVAEITPVENNLTIYTFHVVYSETTDQGNAMRPGVAPSAKLRRRKQWQRSKLRTTLTNEADNEADTDRGAS